MVPGWCRPEIQLEDYKLSIMFQTCFTLTGYVFSLDYCCALLALLNPAVVSF